MAIVTITGVEQVIQNLQRLQSKIKMSVPTGLNEAADKLRDDSILRLQSCLGTSNPTWGRWGHSAEQRAIQDKGSWEKTFSQWNKLTLTSTSEHSAIVEFGGTKRIDVEKYSNGAWAWPIGLSQGNVVAYSRHFHLQVGYHYLTNTINNPQTLNNMVNEVSKILSRTTRSVGI